MYRFILFIFFLSSSFAQNILLRDTTFNVNSIKIHYHEYLIFKSDEYSDDSTLAKLDITDSNNSILQTITLEINAMSSPLDTDDSYSILGKRGIALDYNFDGYEDLALRFGNAPDNHAVNGYFYIYLFNPNTKTFDRYEEELTNPLPVPEIKKVDCTYVYSTVYPHTLTEFYEWVDDKLMISESIEYQQLYEQPEEDVILTKETKIIYQNGIELKKEENILRDKIK